MTVRRARGGAGFTLVEVVVSIALFALLMSLVYGAFGTAVRAHDAGLARTEKGQSMRVVSEFLRHSVAAAAPVAAVDGDEWSVMLRGDSQTLRYVVDLPGHVGDGGLHEIVVEQEGDADRQQLVLRRRPLYFDEHGAPEGEFLSKVLLPRSEAFAVRYFGVAEDEETPAWVDEWSGMRRLPLLVELAITPRDGPPWPPLRVHPRGNTVRYLGNARSGRAPQAEGEPDAQDSGEPATGAPPAPQMPEGRIQ